ncbi:hypothetical protein WA158_006664 [Blastocystis sp. Blastoise]
MAEEKSKKQQLVDRLYTKKTILAPMVRCGSFPFRLLCLQNGCDTVFSEETVAQKVICAKRTINKILNTVDYTDSKTGQIVFRTSKEERDHLVLQLGTPNADLALQAANILIQDVDAIDINMGCPKRFSVQGAMGSSLLSTPTIACDIIKTLSTNLSIPISAKIRLLSGPIENTIQFILKLQESGASAVTIHCRHVEDHPKIPADKDIYLQIENDSRIHIPLIYNGDIYTHEELLQFQKIHPNSGVMIGRGALMNASIFNKEIKSVENIIKEYLLISAKYFNRFSNTKYCLWRMLCISSKHLDEKGDKTHRSKTWEEWGSIWGISKEIETQLEIIRNKENELNIYLSEEGGIAEEEGDTVINNENQKKKIDEGELIRKRLRENEIKDDIN